jgi:hypothetical protein
MATAQDGAVEIFADIVRFSTLDQNGFVGAGSATWTTAGLIKATLTPTLESGDDIAIKLASGNLGTMFRHGDMAKYYTFAIDIIRPDQGLEAALAGGTAINDSTTTAVTTPTAPTPTPGTAGVLASGTYSFRVSAYNQYGETLACASTSTGAVTGPTGSVSLSIPATTGAVGFKIYFGPSGQELFIARVIAAASGATTYVITGSAIPVGALPAANTTAGPGANVAYAAPNMGVVGNPNGVGVELFGKAVIQGQQVSYLPYWRWCIPGVKNLAQAARDFTNAALQNTFNGQAFPNANWGTGPFGDWNIPTTQVWQRQRCGLDIVPVDALTSLVATV